MQLEDMGLTKTESLIYITCLKVGVATAYEISKKSKLPKSTCYDALFSLEKKGFISTVRKNKKLNFIPCDPCTFSTIIEEKKTQVDLLVTALNGIKKSAAVNQKVEQYEGKEGIKSILKDIINSNSELLIIGNFARFKEYLVLYADLFVKRRKENKIKCRVIESKSKENKALSKHDRMELRQTKFIKGFENLNSELYIYGDKVAIVSLNKGEPVGIILENGEMSKLFQVLFHILWAQR